MSDHLGGYVPGGDHRTWHPELWQEIIDRWHPTTFLDVGCAEGHAMRWWVEHGVNTLGVEGCPTAVRNHLLPHCVVQHDFTTGPWSPPTPIDVAWCCEVVEHVEEAYTPNLLAAFSTTRMAFVSHAVPRQSGYHHVNCQDAPYWIDRFAATGLVHSPELSEWARYHARHGFYANTGMVFARLQRSLAN